MSANYIRVWNFSLLVLFQGNTGGRALQTNRRNAKRQQTDTGNIMAYVGATHFLMVDFT